MQVAQRRREESLSEFPNQRGRRNMNKLRIKSLLIAFAALAVFAVTIAGQVTGGAVTGTVLDPNGGAVVGATVLLYDKTRGQDHTAETTSAGSYSFPNVQTGN